MNEQQKARRMSVNLNMKARILMVALALGSLLTRVTPSLRNASFVRLSATLIGLTAIVPGCAYTAKEAVTAFAADYVLTNGKVYTVNEKQPWAEAVVVKGNEIVFVGSTADAQKLIGENPFDRCDSAADGTAINQATGERFIVRYHAEKFYDAVTEMAQPVGIGLEDG